MVSHMLAEASAYPVGNCGHHFCRKEGITMLASIDVKASARKESTIASVPVKATVCSVGVCRRHGRRKRSIVVLVLIAVDGSVIRGLMVTRVPA